LRWARTSGKLCYQESYQTNLYHIFYGPASAIFMLTAGVAFEVAREAFDLVSGFVGDAVDAFGDLIYDAGNFFNDFGNAVGGFLSGVGDFMGDVLDGINNLIFEFGEHLNNLIDQLRRLLGDSDTVNGRSAYHDDDAVAAAIDLSVEQQDKGDTSEPDAVGADAEVVLIATQIEPLLVSGPRILDDLARQHDEAFILTASFPDAAHPSMPTDALRARDGATMPVLLIPDDAFVVPLSWNDHVATPASIQTVIAALGSSDMSDSQPTVREYPWSESFEEATDCATLAEMDWLI